MAIFEIYGGNAPNSVAAYGNGITLGILGTLLSSVQTLWTGFMHVHMY